MTLLTLNKSFNNALEIRIEQLKLKLWTRSVYTYMLCTKQASAFTIKLVVHSLVDPLCDAGQPLVEAHRHCTLIHNQGTPWDMQHTD